MMKLYPSTCSGSFNNLVHDDRLHRIHKYYLSHRQYDPPQQEPRSSDEMIRAKEFHCSLQS